MASFDMKNFGQVITRLINKEDLRRNESFQAFSTVLTNSTTAMHQGAFLAALTAKGETREEICGCWDAIYHHDTIKISPSLDRPIVENCGTGMDSFKTFNISTCASIIAAAAGIPIARHGARAITSVCGTVDIAEALGVDVECTVETVAESLKKTNLGLFNGMSPTIHPKALGRILSQISFGSTLNIAASLANPVKPDIGVRGVYAKEMIRPVIEVMKLIGYKKALVFYGTIDNHDFGMDEASVCGITHYAQLIDDQPIEEFSLRPEEVGLTTQSPDLLSPANNLQEESKRVISLLQGRERGIRFDTAVLNAALILYLADKTDTIVQGVTLATDILKSGAPIDTLNNWVAWQNRNPQAGLKTLNRLCNN